MAERVTDTEVGAGLTVVLLTHESDGHQTGMTSWRECRRAGMVCQQQYSRTQRGGIGGDVDYACVQALAAETASEPLTR
jgi:hypothetical protein